MEQSSAADYCSAPHNKTLLIPHPSASVHRPEVQELPCATDLSNLVLYAQSTITVISRRRAVQIQI